MKKKILAIAAASAAIIALSVTPAQAASAAPTGNIVEVAVAASGGGAPDANPNDYDILVQAVLATGLAPTLSDPAATYTVYAPNDRAFQWLVRDLTGTYPKTEAAALAVITSALTLDQISNVLLYHVLSGEALTGYQTVFAGELTMANGGTVTPKIFNLVDETPTFADPRLVLRAIDIEATNGIINTIDKVLLPSPL